MLSNLVIRLTRLRPRTRRRRATQPVSNSDARELVVSGAAVDDSGPVPLITLKISVDMLDIFAGEGAQPQRREFIVRVPYFDIWEPIDSIEARGVAQLAHELRSVADHLRQCQPSVRMAEDERHAADQ